MNEKPGNNSKKAIIVAIIVILTGAWYWFSYRPSKIRARCATLTYSTDASDRTEKQQMEFDTYYTECLKRFGLK